jgi:hypothetical protein
MVALVARGLEVHQSVSTNTKVAVAHMRNLILGQTDTLFATI